MKAWQRGRGRQVLAIGVAVAVALVCAGQARAAFPGRSGQISFATNATGSFQIARLNAGRFGNVTAWARFRSGYRG